MGPSKHLEPLQQSLIQTQAMLGFFFTLIVWIFRRFKETVKLILTLSVAMLMATSHLTIASAPTTFEQAKN